MRHTIKSCVLIVVLGFAVLGCGSFSEDVARTHRAAYAAEREAVAALRELDGGVSLQELSVIRPRYHESIETAQSLRAELKSLLETEHSRRWIGRGDVSEVMALNEDLIRCHASLGERAEEAFRYMEDGRARRGFRHDVWGFIDPRGCFDELSPIVEGYLQ